LPVQSDMPIDGAASRFGVDLSVLARVIPVAMVCEVLAAAQVVSRARRTSAVLGVYLVLAAALFPAASVPRVFEKLTGVFGRGGVAVPNASSLNARRASLPALVFQLLFGRLASAGAGGSAARWRGLLVCAWDGTTLAAPDSAGNRVTLGCKSNQNGPGAFPRIRLLLLVACGTRTLLDAAVAPVGVGENTMAEQMTGALRAGMLLLADRLFPGYRLWCACAGTGSDLLWRVSSSIRLSVDQALPDGSALAVWTAPSSLSGRTRRAEGLADQTVVRIVQGWITVIDDAGVRRSENYRLITTLLDPGLHPADELIRLYARRWQVEIMIKGLKCVQHVSGTTLRSKTAAGVHAEAWAYLCVHQVLRLTAARAAGSGTDIAQISFTTLVNRFRDTVIRTGGRPGAAAELARLHIVTAEDLTPLSIRIRHYHRVKKNPVSKFPSKKPHHGGTVITLDYTIDPYPDHNPEPQLTTTSPIIHR
jgi:hypothetical protein